MKKYSLIILLFVSSNTISQNTFPSSGPVGIGTTNTNNGKLTINGTDINLLRLENEFYGGESVMRFRSKTTNGDNFHADISTYGDGGFLGFKVPYNNTIGSGYNMVIANTGNIGIGTANPLTLFNVTLGAGDATVGSAAIRIGGTSNYPSLELGVKGAYDGMISTYGNDLHLYAGNWRSAGATASENHNIFFYTSQASSSNWNTAKLMLRYDGNVGIGTTSPSEKLSVNGNIRSKKLIVTQTGWADYVLNENYRLKSLSELESYIKKNKHLPEIPSAKEVEKDGIDIGENQALLLKKIEELTLYMIEMKKEIYELKKINKQ